MTKQHLLKGASLVATLLLASCAGHWAAENGRGDEVDPQVAYPITVGPHMETLVVTAGSDAQVQGFASAFIASGNGSMTVSAPTPEAGRQVADRLAALGVPRNRIVMGAMVPGGAVQLSYVGYGASSPECDAHWPNLSWTLENLPSPNWGCSTQHNLAAMIADPRDLVNPQTMTPPDTERRMIVIEKWRRGEPTSSQKTQEQSGAVTQVGQ
jgi:pilus assembly protein CpaD